MWCPKWGTLSIRPNIEVVVDTSESRGSGQPRTSPLSIIPRAAVGGSSSNPRRMVEFKEGDMENIVKLECWGKR